MENVVRRKIMWGDLDSLGIVFYPRYYEWIDSCGHLFFEAIGLNMRTLWKERGILFGLIETGCKYHLPGRYHDEIEIRTSLNEIKEKTIKLKHDIYRIDGGLMVEGFEQRICLEVKNPDRFRAIPIPPDIKAILEKRSSP